MEENGITGDVMVSEETKKLLETDPNLKYNYKKHVDVKVSKSSDKTIGGYIITQKYD